VASGLRLDSRNYPGAAFVPGGTGFQPVVSGILPETPRAPSAHLRPKPSAKPWPSAIRSAKPVRIWNSPRRGLIQESRELPKLAKHW